MSAVSGADARWLPIPGADDDILWSLGNIVVKAHGRLRVGLVRLLRRLERDGSGLDEWIGYGCLGLLRALLNRDELRFLGDWDVGLGDRGVELGLTVGFGDPKRGPSGAGGVGFGDRGVRSQGLEEGSGFGGSGCQVSGAGEVRFRGSGSQVSGAGRSGSGIGV